MKSDGVQRILIIVNEFPPDILAGTAMSTFYLASHLAANGIDAHVAVTMREKGTPPVERRNGVTVHRINPVQIRGTRMMQTFTCLWRLARAIRPDVIQGQAISCGLLASLLGKVLGKPSVTYIQGYDLYHAGPLQRATELKFSLMHSSAVLAVTEDLREKAMAVYPRPDAVVMPHGLEMESHSAAMLEQIREEYPFLSGGRVILYTGQLNRRKGLSHLIEAVGILRADSNDVRLLLVGKGPEEDSLREWADRNGVADRVCFIGAVDHARVLALMNASDIFVLPSLEEPFGIVLVEAMSQGLPVVASNVQGIPSIIEDGVNGFLVPPGDSRALAERILHLSENEAIGKRMGERNRQDSARYRWSGLAKRYIDIYRKIQASHGK